MIWLEEYHINKYVKKYDARTEGRYLNPPRIRSDFQIGDLIVIIPQGRHKIEVGKGYAGRIGYITEMSKESHKESGRVCTIKFINSRQGSATIREIHLKLKKSVDISVE